MATDPDAVVREAIQESVATQQRLLEPDIVAAIGRAGATITRALASGGKLLLFGNGGSASDASHIATEFVVRFVRERRALPAIALSADTSVLTATGNDFGFERVFARQVEALGAPGDVALAISTSGCSANVLSAAKMASERGLATIGLTGADGGDLAGLVDVCVRVPAQSTARIQESHILIAHVLCELVEQDLV